MRVIGKLVTAIAMEYLLARRWEEQGLILKFDRRTTLILTFLYVQQLLIACIQLWLFAVWTHYAVRVVPMTVILFILLMITRWAFLGPFCCKILLFLNAIFSTAAWNYLINIWWVLGGAIPVTVNRCYSFALLAFIVNFLMTKLDVWVVAPLHRTVELLYVSGDSRASDIPSCYDLALLLWMQLAISDQVELVLRPLLRQCILCLLESLLLDRNHSLFAKHFPMLC